jgi:hypothetical protein
VVVKGKALFLVSNKMAFDMKAVLGRRIDSDMRTAVANQAGGYKVDATDTSAGI